MKIIRVLVQDHHHRPRNKMAIKPTINRHHCLGKTSRILTTRLSNLANNIRTLGYHRAKSPWIHRKNQVVAALNVNYVDRRHQPSVVQSALNICSVRRVTICTIGIQNDKLIRERSLITNFNQNSGLNQSRLT